MKGDVIRVEHAEELEERLAVESDNGIKIKLIFLNAFGNRKRLAGIEKHGGVHAFSRHSVGSFLVKRGCDILTIKGLMRHSDVHTTMRYLHIADSTKRQKYEQYLVL